MANANWIVKSAEKVAEKMTGETSGAFYQASLAGALSAHIHTLCSKLAAFEAPTSKHQCLYATEGGELVVNYDVEPSDDSVGWSGGVDLDGVYCNGMEISDLLTDATFEAIKEACYEAFEQDVEDAKADAADHYYQSRKDDEMTGAL